MKAWITTTAAAVALAGGLSLTAPALAADVGVSISISEPGVYGRIDIGRFPQPALVLQQPVIVHQPAVLVGRPQPVYMYVPQAHRVSWRQYCGRYGACGVPVYFVQHPWYERQVKYVVQRDGPRRDWDDRRDDRRDWDDRDGHPGKGHGKGHDNGRGKHGRD